MAAWWRPVPSQAAPFISRRHLWLPERHGGSKYLTCLQTEEIASSVRGDSSSAEQHPQHVSAAASITERLQGLRPSLFSSLATRSVYQQGLLEQLAAVTITSGMRPDSCERKARDLSRSFSHSLFQTASCCLKWGERSYNLKDSVKTAIFFCQLCFNDILKGRIMLWFFFNSSEASDEILFHHEVRLFSHTCECKSPIS